MVIEIKNQIEIIVNQSCVDDVNEIIRKIKLMKIVLDNLITENVKNQKEIENILNNNINLKNNNLNNKTKDINNLPQNYQDFHIISNDFEINEQNNLKNIILKSIFNNSDYGGIARSIFEQCIDLKQGYWTVVVGEKDKYKIHRHENNSLAVNIGPLKIVINYC